MKHITEIEPIADARGVMHVVQAEIDIPFLIRRFFYITGVPQGAKRGFHAHAKEQQCCICMQGSCRFVLDDGVSRSKHVLDAPGKLLNIPRMTWIEMDDFTPGCILLVVCDMPYDPQERICDYDEFTELVKKGSGQDPE